jgi:uncharacterized protein (TIGR03382 family)
MRRTLAVGLVLASGTALAGPVQSPILGGTPTTSGEYPQTVAILLGGALCTGTLIAPDWVLTAAHCVTPSELMVSTQQQVTQLVSVHFNALRADQGTIVRAIDTIPDPMFNVNALGSHDSGLIHLASKVTDIAPVKLNFDPAKAPVGVQVTMVGYGVSNTSTQQAGTEYVVQQTSVSCVPQVGDNANLLCFNQTSGQGKCNGDSGGPSFVTLDGGKLLEVGVTSFGDQNCQQFGADTRVDAEKAFIQQHVPNLYCDTDADCAMGHECFQNTCIMTPFQPTGVGATCTDNSSCESGECAMNGKDSKCTMDCTVGDKTSCPSGFDCLAGGAAGVCWPSSTDGGGCCDAGGHGAPTALVGIGLFGAVLLRRRRRA